MVRVSMRFIFNYKKVFNKVNLYLVVTMPRDTKMTGN